MCALAIPPPSTRPTLVGVAPLFVMIGGFLGSGKTALAAQLGAHLRGLGKRTAFITNGQGGQLVDAQALRGRGFATEQVSGGCFCSRFDLLTAASARLAAEVRPEVVIAEPMGSCADLTATIRNPLGRLHGSEHRLAPFTVALDATRAARFFSGHPGAVFSEEVRYLIRKQLEEADIILLNKADLADAGALEALERRVRADFPAARAMRTSARTGLGLEEWIAAVMDGSPGRRGAVDLDPEKYREGEARLGWLNCTLQLSALRGFRCNPVLLALGEEIRRELQGARIEMAHLKMALSADVDVEGIATLNLVGNESPAELGEELAEPVERGCLNLNLRAEGKPDLLHAAVTNAMTHVWTQHPSILARVTLMEHFRPIHPPPTHRFASMEQ